MAVGNRIEPEPEPDRFRFRFWRFRFRVLKPGQYFANYEWCITDFFDPNNENHQRIKREVELGDIRSMGQCIEALKHAGFEVKILERVGLAPEGSQKVQAILEQAADALVEGGKLINGRTTRPMTPKINVSNRMEIQ